MDFNQMANAHILHAFNPANSLLNAQLSLLAPHLLQQSYNALGLSRDCMSNIPVGMPGCPPHYGPLLFSRSATGQRFNPYIIPPLRGSGSRHRTSPNVSELSPRHQRTVCDQPNVCARDGNHTRLRLPLPEDSPEHVSPEETGRGHGHGYELKNMERMLTGLEKGRSRRSSFDSNSLN